MVELDRSIVGLLDVSGLLWMFDGLVWAFLLDQPEYLYLYYYTVINSSNCHTCG